MPRPLTVISISLLSVLNTLAQTGNILNNGGFETGLMCYNDWIWSYTGQDFKGDYKFALSDDAHTGLHSLEIACKGTDCLKAAIISNTIPITTAGQSYKISLYSKCPANTNNFIYLPETAAGGASKTLTCNGAWAPNEITFQAAPASQQFLFYIFNADISWLHVDDVVVTYADGTVPSATVLHPGVRPVTISGQNVTVDNKPYLSLGYVNVPFSDLSMVASTGANTVNGLGSYNNAGCFNTGQPGYMDRAYELGLNFLPDSTTTARLMVPAIFPPIIQTFAPHLAMIGWSLADEPDLIELPFTYIPASTLTAEYNAAKSGTSLPLTFDSQHAAYDTASFLSPYTGAADLWMAEPYGTDFGSVAHAVSVFNSLQKRPIWLYQDSIAANLIVPKAYWAVIKGATGIHYFSWDQFKADSLKLAASKQVFTELNSLNTALFATNMDSAVGAPAALGYTARYVSASDSLYLLSVNPVLNGTVADVQANFTVNGLTAGQKVNVLFESRSITAVAGGFSDTFTGASRHVYVVAGYKKGTVPTLTAVVSAKSGADAARDWKITVSNSGLGAASATQISKVTFNQSSGKPCTPLIAANGLPISLGDIPVGGGATGDLITNFTGCASTARFNVNVTLTANGGSVNTTVVLSHQTK